MRLGLRMHVQRPLPNRCGACMCGRNKPLPLSSKHLPPPLFQVGYGVIVCDHLKRSQWQVIQSMLPRETTPRSLGQQVLKFTPNANDLSFPDISWDTLLNSWILPAVPYKGTAVLSSKINNRSQLFWVATLMRHPFISAYLEGMDSFPCWLPGAPDWCSGYYTRDDTRIKATNYMCAIVNAWRNLAACNGSPTCISNYVS